MKIENFRSLRRRVPFSEAPEHVKDGFDPDDANNPPFVHVYPGEAWIAELADGTFSLILCQDEHTSTKLDELEVHLHEWAESEIFNDGEHGLCEPAVDPCDPCVAANVKLQNIVLLSALEKSGEATTEQLARYTRTPRAEVECALEELESAGEVARFGVHWRPSHARVLDFAQRALRVVREQRERNGFGVFGPADAFANIARIAAELKLV